MAKEPGTIEAVSEAGAAICRFVKDPSPDCYCMRITGSTINKIITLCAGDHNSCAIYRHRTDSAAAVPPARPGREEELSL